MVLEGAALGHPEIVVHPVRAHHPGSRLVGAPQPAPFRLRQVVRDGFALTRDGEISAGDARAHIARDCAADIARLLASDATWDGHAVEAGHVAVLVSDRNKGMLVQEQLRARGIPAVVAGGGQVFKEPAVRRLAGPARRARRATPERPRPRRGTHLLLRPHHRRARQPVATPSPTTSPTGSGAGRCCCAARESRRCSRRRRHAGSASGSCDASAARGS